MLKFTPPPCSDCGPHAVFHRAEYLEALLSGIVRIYALPYEASKYVLTRIIGPDRRVSLYPFLLQSLSRMGFGTLSRDPHPHECSRTKALREEAEHRGIDLQEFRLFGKDSNHFIARWHDTTIAFEFVPRPPHTTPATWMDRKDRMRDAFAAARIPIANGDVCARSRTALKLFERLKKPIIVKPHLGSRSRHTTIRLTTQENFMIAFKKAQRLSPWVIVEEELCGDLYRGTVVGGKTIAILRRDPPRVIGNGTKTVRELVEYENQQPYRHAGIFEPIPTDHEAEQELQRQGLHWNSVPAHGHIVILNPKFGRGQGSLNEDVTERAHPDNIQLLEEAARIIHDPLIGMDFIMTDISRSWKEQPRSGIIECNSAPFIDIHQYPFLGKPRNVAGALWELVFPGSGEIKLDKTRK